MCVCVCVCVCVSVSVYLSALSLTYWMSCEWALLILQPFRHFTCVKTHSPTLPSLYLRHTHSPTLPSLYLCHSRAHSPTFPSLHLRHNSFSNPFVALPTSQLILQPFSVASPTSYFILQPFFHFSYVTSSSLNSPGEPPMIEKEKSFAWMKRIIYIVSGWVWLTLRCEMRLSFTKSSSSNNMKNLCFGINGFIFVSSTFLYLSYSTKTPRNPWKLHLNFLCRWSLSSVTNLIWRFPKNFTSWTRNPLEMYGSYRVSTVDVPEFPIANCARGVTPCIVMKNDGVLHQVSTFSPESMRLWSLCQSERTTARDLVQHKRLTYPCSWALNTEHQQRWTRWWCTTPSKHLQKMINKGGDYIEGT